MTELTVEEIYSEYDFGYGVRHRDRDRATRGCMDSRLFAARSRRHPTSNSRREQGAVGLETVKQEAAQYLLGQYTNSDGEMICQVCKGPLPFKLDDGTPYFEKVEFVLDLKKRHYQNYLALCPNHGAMFQHANGSSDSIRSLFLEMTSNELKVVLAQRDMSIFTKTHIADLRTVIQTETIDQSLTEADSEHNP